MESSSNISSADLDEETLKKLRGDSIGTTSYSESFVLKTLMQLSDLQWNEEIEENLCFLWDMTEESDVCEYLLQLSFPSVACGVILKYEESRLLEIIVGIFANILCSKCEKQIEESDIELVMNMLSSDDPYILIQVMRFLHAVFFIFTTFTLKSEDLDRVQYILENSANAELLGNTLKALSVATEDTRSGPSLNPQLFVASITAFNNSKNADVEADFTLETTHANFKHLVKIVANFCILADKEETCLKTTLRSNFAQFLNLVSKLFIYYQDLEFTSPVDETFTFYIEAVTYMFTVLNLGYEPDIFGSLCRILLASPEENTEIIGQCRDLYCYFRSLNCSECERDLKMFKDSSGRLKMLYDTYPN